MEGSLPGQVEVAREGVYIVRVFFHPRNLSPIELHPGDLGCRDLAGGLEKEAGPVEVAVLVDSEGEGSEENKASNMPRPGSNKGIGKISGEATCEKNAQPPPGKLPVLGIHLCKMTVKPGKVA